MGGPSYMFGENLSVIKISTIPSSWWKKCVPGAVAAKIIRLCQINKLADVLSKHLSKLWVDASHGTNDILRQRIRQRQEEISSTGGVTEGCVSCNSILAVEPGQDSADWCTVGKKRLAKHLHRVILVLTNNWAKDYSTHIELLPFMSSSISEIVESNKLKLDCQKQCIHSISEIENDFEYAAWWYNLIGVKRVMFQNCRSGRSVKASCHSHSIAPTLSLGQTEELAV